MIVTTTTAIGSQPAVRSWTKEEIMTTTHRAATTTLLVLSLAAASAPTAGARPTDFTPMGRHAPTAVYSRPDKSLIPVTAPSPTDGTVVKQSASPPIVRIQAPVSGFDWGDAGIGAAGGLVLSMIGLGGAFGVSQYRTRRTRNTTALTS
jgi:hypothetical protein